MSSQSYAGAGQATAAAGQKPAVLLAPFGWYTRYMLRSYAQHVAVVTSGLLIVALTIDLSPWLQSVMAANPEAKGLAAAAHLGYYLSLRAVDLATRLLPFGCFLGVLICEISHTWSRERLMVWNSGRSPAQCLTPVLILGLVVGVLQVTLETYLRPMTIVAQAAGRLGAHGIRYDRSPSDKRHWIAAGNDLIHTRIEFGPPPLLREPVIYRFTPQGELTEVYSAESATPAANENRWVLHQHDRRKLGGRGDAAQPSAAAGLDPPSGGTEQEIALRLDPLWLTYFGIDAKFLPQSALAALASPRGGLYPTAEYRTWMHVRNASLLLPGAMMLLATSLSLLFIAYAIRFEAVLGIALAGYGSHIGNKAFVLLGEHGYLPPALAAWLTPIALLVGSALVLAVVKWRRFAFTRAA